MTESCFHCGLAIPQKSTWSILIRGEEKRLCCPGCQAVATMILEHGLDDYYSLRDQFAISQKTIPLTEIETLEALDQFDIQEPFLLSQNQEHHREIILKISGITCAACVWLIEKQLKQLPGILRCHVNLTTHRSVLAWDPTEIKLSTILKTIRHIGYIAEPLQLTSTELERTQESRQALKRLAVAGFGFGQVMMFVAPLYGWFTDTIPLEYRDFFRWVSLLVTTPILVYVGYPFFKGALRSLKRKVLTMDSSISLALITVYLAGAKASWTGTGEVYFDSIIMFLFFITLSRYLELRARHRANFVIEKLNQQQPQWVCRQESDGTFNTIAFNKIRFEDILLIKPGEVIPVDGTVLSGQSTVNESLLTGEFLPKEKAPGSPVIAGSHNVHQPLTIKVSHIGNQTSLARLLQLHEQAQQEKSYVVSLANKVSHYFILTIILIAGFSYGVWHFMDPSKAFWIFISILVVTCPCALALATPIAMTVSLNRLAKLGVLVTRSHVIETLVKVTDIIFDKTGTLTQGAFCVAKIETFSHLSSQQALNIIAALEQYSEHPIATAFKDIEITDLVTHVELSASAGLSGYVNGIFYAVGNHHFIQKKLPQVRLPISRGLLLVDETALQAIVYLEDSLKPEVEALIHSLKQQYTLHLLSGDHATTVQTISKHLKIPHSLAMQSAQDKYNYIQKLQQETKIIAVLGDGMNDAPILAKAHVSIAVSNATDLTRTHADIVLLESDLSILPRLFQYAQKTHRIIRQNLIWALLYNIISLPLAFLGLIPPYLAAILMSTSSLFVVLNALRLYESSP